MLLILTVATGAVDAVAVLRLGRVFVANMTGNVVFVGFALARSPGFSLSASLFALGGFTSGAACGGLLARRLGQDRAVLIRGVVVIELFVLAVAMVVALEVGTPLGACAKDMVAALCAVAMGMQNAMARRLAVPDLITTNVLTSTLTGLAGDLWAEDRRPIMRRRLLSIGAIFVGALGGAELVLHLGAGAGLVLVVALLAVVATWSTVMVGRPGRWRAT
jgi:uncharacterized membrane protein YoaK (UPF0700 family)